MNFFRLALSRIFSCVSSNMKSNFTHLLRDSGTHSHFSETLGLWDNMTRGHWDFWTMGLLENGTLENGTLGQRDFWTMGHLEKRTLGQCALETWALEP